MYHPTIGVEHIGLTRQYTVQCEVNEPFRISKAIQVIRGEQFFKSGELCFPGVEPFGTQTAVYRTVFGPAFHFDAPIYSKNDQNMSIAMRRLLCVRLPDELGRHEAMQEMQRGYLLANTTLEDCLTRDIAADLDVDDSFEERIRRAWDPHPKRELRIRAMTGLMDDGKIGLADWHGFKPGVMMNFKNDEYGKPGKKPRAVCDLGVEASLVGFILAEAMKDVLSRRPHVVHNFQLLFVKKACPAVIERMFESLLTRDCMVLFSDDSCLSINIMGQRRMFNMDISSCDASHTGALFQFLRRITPGPYQATMDALIRQCEQDFTVRSSFNRQNKVVFRSSEATLFSGSALTTLLNGCANMLIGDSIASSNIQSPADIIQAAERAGYIVTLAECLIPEELQFLKCSPVETPEGWIPLLNLGVLLRAVGRCRSDLPGQGCLITRAKAFNRGIIHGMYPQVQFTLKRLLQEVNAGDESEASFRAGFESVSLQSSSSHSLPDELVYRRYAATTEQIIELHALVKRATVFSMIHCSLSAAILKIDYGY